VRKKNRKNIFIKLYNNQSNSMDVFGIKKVYQDKSGGPSWNGLHWANGVSRTLTAGQKDSYDKTQCSENRGNVPWTIDGKGFLWFNGKCTSKTEPRFHLNNPSSYFFRDVECTMYMMRMADDNTNWAGPNCGVRSGPNGHSISSEYCDAHTYYQRIRYDGNMDIEKELKHPDSSTRCTTNVWNGGKFPFNQWVGYKSVTYNTVVNGVQGVRMELYRDMTNGTNGGTWELLGTTTDTGGWAPPQSSPVCSYAKDYIPLTGGGVIVMRNTGVSNCQYKWMTVREIVPTKCSIIDIIDNKVNENKVNETTINETKVNETNSKCNNDVPSNLECNSGICHLNKQTTNQIINCDMNYCNIDNSEKESKNDKSKNDDSEEKSENKESENKETENKEKEMEGWCNLV
jgi:hypothetical protein